jgi:hypothetical protein
MNICIPEMVRIWRSLIFPWPNTTPLHATRERSDGDACNACKEMEETRRWIDRDVRHPHFAGGCRPRNKHIQSMYVVASSHARSAVSRAEAGGILTTPGLPCHHERTRR